MYDLWEWEGKIKMTGKSREQFLTLRVCLFFFKKECFFQESEGEVKWVGLVSGQQNAWLPNKSPLRLLERLCRWLFWETHLAAVHGADQITAPSRISSSSCCCCFLPGGDSSELCADPHSEISLPSLCLDFSANETESLKINGLRSETSTQRSSQRKSDATPSRFCRRVACPCSR